MPTSHKHQPISLEQVLNAFDHTLIVSEQLGWKHLRHEMFKIQRTHDLILKIFEDSKRDIRDKIDAVGELVLHSYQEELTHAKASDAHEFAKKINNHNNNLHYARMLALILRDLSPKMTDGELIKLIKARQVEKVHDMPHDQFYDISPVKATKKETKRLDYIVRKRVAKPAVTKTTAAKKATTTKTPVKKIAAKKTPTLKASSAKKTTKVSASTTTTKKRVVKKAK